MHDGVKSLGVFVAAAAIVWHVLTVLSPAWVLTKDQQQARDDRGND